MITLFSTCKPFRGVYERIQWNALRSWAHMKPRPDVILFGDDDGTAKAACELNFKHIPNTPCRHLQESDHDWPGLFRQARKPYLPDMVHSAEAHATGNVLVYVNADIVLTNLTEVAEQVAKQISRFLMVGQRYNIQLPRSKLEFTGKWIEFLRAGAKLHLPCGIDYLIFTKGLWPELPKFTIGHIGFDNYLVDTTVAMGVPVIDATKRIVVFHQEHPIRLRKDEGDWYNVYAANDLWPTEMNGFITDATWTLDVDGSLQKK